MAIQLIISKEAEIDLWNAYLHYEEAQPELGDRFEQQVFVKLEALLKNPDLFPKSLSKYRKCLLDDFPYSIYYEFDSQENQVFVLAIWAHRRNPVELESRK